MPTYSYACNECDHHFDIVQKFTDDSLTVCPECQGPLHKVFSAVGVVFKGSGFYRTDSRSGSSSSVPAGSSHADHSSGNGSSSNGSNGSSGNGSSSQTSGSDSTSKSSSGTATKKESAKAAASA